MLWKDWDRLDAAEIRRRQGALLHRFLKTQVLRYSPFYKEVFRKAGLTADDIRSFDDIRKIPFTTKADIAPTEEDPGKPRSLVLQPDPETYSSTIGMGKKIGLLKDKLAKGRDVRDLVLDEYLPVFFIATTGRTANPTPFLYTSRDITQFKEAARRLFTLAGANRESDFVMNIFPYAPHLAFWIVYQAGIENGLPIYHTGGGKTLGTDRIVNLIERLGTTILVGIPGYLYHVLRLAAERGRDYSKLRLIVLGAERVTKGYKRRIRKLLNTLGSKNPVILSTYGFTEARTAWIECPTENSIEQSTGYHLYPDLEIFEIIDPDTGEWAGEGESGEIVYTCLDWRGSVVLRYRTNDYARGGITMGKCPACGRNVPRLSTNITRLSERSELRLSKIKGTLVDFNEFFAIMNDQPEVVEWQVEISKRDNDPHELDQVHLRLAVKEGTDRNKLAQRIKGLVREHMDVSIEQVTFHTIVEMTTRLGMEERPKELRIIDRRAELESMEDET